MPEPSKEALEDITRSIAARREAQAISACEALLREYPRNAEVLMRLGEAAMRAGDLARAEAAYQRIIDHRPGLGWAHFKLGNVYLNKGMPAAALAAFDQARQAQQAVPADRVNKMIAKAKELSAQKQAAKAKGAGRPLPARPTGSEKAAPADVGPLRKAAAEALKAGKLKEARRVLEQLLERGQRSSEILCRLGEACLRMEDYPAAAAAYREASEADGRCAAAHFGLGRCLAAQGQWPMATEALRAALTLEPDNQAFEASLREANLAALLDLGNKALEANDPAKAAEHFRKLIALQPNHPSAAERLRLAVHLQQTPASGARSDPLSFYRQELESYRAYLDQVHERLRPSLKDSLSPGQSTAAGAADEAGSCQENPAPAPAAKPAGNPKPAQSPRKAPKIKR